MKALPPIDLPQLLAAAEEYKLIAPHPRHWDNLHRLAEGKPLPGEEGASGNNGRASQLPMRLYRALLKEALSRTERWKGGDRSAFHNDKGYMELSAKALAKRACMSIDAVYYTVEELRKAGLIEAYQPGLLLPYLIRVRIDRLIQLCWQLQARERKLRRPGHGKKGPDRADKPWPDRMRRLFLDAHGDRRRAPIMDVVRIINGQCLPGELGAEDWTFGLDSWRGIA
jgi:hypothetical protein